MTAILFDANQRMIKDNTKEEIKPSNGTEKIIFYTTNCPRCQVLKKKMDSLGIDYELNDDIEEMMLWGIQTVPMLRIERELFNSSSTALLDFSQAIKWLKEYEKNEH